MSIKPIAIVLPQFHPIPENDKWWGKGFTEWRNVVKGKPRFPGHYQPHLPSDLGFYDLRLPETREAQAQLARKYGIYGFCYYHYWFQGKTLLERPVNDILKSGKPDFPFMLCWANENWSRNWDGGFNKVLIEQSYSKLDFVRHARHLAPIFKDPRYIRIKDRPVFCIYKDQGIPDLEVCIHAFKNELANHGLDVFLCRFERYGGTSPNRELAYQKFDAGVEFQPLTTQFRRLRETITTEKLKRKRNKAARMLAKVLKRPDFTIDEIYSYHEMVANDIATDFQEGFPIFPGVSPGFDNSSRRVGLRALILDKSTPDLYKFWLNEKIRITNWSLLPDTFVFINSWNEWAEGNHLEPCERWGHKYLEATRDVVDKYITSISI